jgi:hypothetical protein
MIMTYILQQERVKVGIMDFVKSFQNRNLY